MSSSRVKLGTAAVAGIVSIGSMCFYSQASTLSKTRTVATKPSTSSSQQQLAPPLISFKKSEKPTALIIGAGVVGVCSAYHLEKRGFKVVVLDSSDGPTRGSTAVAAGGMQRSNPVIDRTSWKNIIISMMGFENNFKYFFVNWSLFLTDPHFLRFMIGFAYSSLFQPANDLARRTEQLAFTGWAIDEFEAFMKNNPKLAKACSFSRCGAMLLNTSHVENSLEKEIYCSDRTALETIDPAVKSLTLDIQEGVYQPNALSADSQAFTRELAKKLEKDPSVDISFHYNVHVNVFESNANTSRLSKVNTSQGTIELNHNTQVVLAAGAWIPKLLYKCGYYAPVYPLKGYCAIVSCNDAGYVPVTGIVSDGTMFLSPFKRECRVASMGEFSGWHTDPTPHVDLAFRNRAKEFGVHLDSTISTSCGLRPMVADGGILIGHVDACPNLSLVVGPGSNGWKVAFGASAILAQCLDPTPPLPGTEIGAGRFDTKLFSPRHRVKLSPLFASFCQERKESS